MPSFVAARRAARPRRRVDRLPRAAPRRRPSAGRRGSGSTARAAASRGRPVGRAAVTSTAPRRSCSPRSLFEAAGVPRGRDPRARSRALGPTSAAELLADLVGERRNRRHRPGRGFEALRYRFEIVSDYGAFRDLQRHRMLTCPVAALGPDLGAGRARGGRRRPGVGDRLRAGARALARRARRGSSRPGRPEPRPTRSASATGSATCST